MDGLSSSILPPIDAPGSVFFAGKPGYTIRVPEKIALVTGASAGFGLLTSIELARADFRVVATLRGLGRGDRLDQAISTAGVAAKLAIRALDVTRFDAIPGFFDAVVRDHGRLDVLVKQCGLCRRRVCRRHQTRRVAASVRDEFFRRRGHDQSGAAHDAAAFASDTSFRYLALRDCFGR
jgi:NAD(P)-dependent dehydrogenase (short-subunit alcohol dehydrogenase family)